MDCLELPKIFLLVRCNTLEKFGHDGTGENFECVVQSQPKCGQKHNYLYWGWNES